MQESFNRIFVKAEIGEKNLSNRRSKRIEREKEREKGRKKLAKEGKCAVEMEKNGKSWGEIALEPDRRIFLFVSFSVIKS